MVRPLIDHSKSFQHVEETKMQRVILVDERLDFILLLPQVTIFKLKLIVARNKHIM